jgi:hypothetical protein
MADLELFWRKTPLGPLGVNESLLTPIEINCGNEVTQSEIK